MSHEDNSTEKHTDHNDGEHRTEQPENGRQSPPSATKDPGSESSTGSGENQKNMDPTKLQNREEQPRKCSQPSGVEDKGSGPQSDSEGKQENLNHTKLQNKKTKDGEGKAGSSSQSLQEQPGKAAQSQSSHVEDQDSRSFPDSEGKQENTKSSNLEIKEAGISSENGSGSPSDSVGNQENPTEMLNKKMLHEKDSLQNHPYHKDGEGLNRQSSQEHQGKRRLGKDTDTSPDSGGNQENTNKLQKKEMFHGNDSSQTCPKHKAGESGTAFSRQSSREQPEKPTQSRASGVEETGLGSRSRSRTYQTPCRNDSSQMRECLNYVGGAGSSRQSSQEPHGKRRYSQSAGEDTGSGSPSDSGGNQESTYPIGLLKKEPECHMQLETLSPTRDHTVLIDTKAFQYGKLVPYQGQHVWDGNHVKLLPDFPPSGFQSRWKVTQKALNKLMKNKASVRDVEEAIKTYNQAYRAEWDFDCLYSFEKRLQPQDNIFSQVIPKIAKLALQLPDLIKHPIPLLRQQHSHAITLSQEQISCLLANGFFCTFPHRNATKPGSEYSNFPTINFSSLFGDSHSCARKIEKLRCLFHYFNTVTDKDKKPEGLVTFERICIPENKLPTWKKQKETLTKLHVTSEGSIEKEGSGMLQVDFASKFIGGGVLGKGLVQEEIRFLMSPELIVARLFTEKLADNECLRITGAQTYSITSGYSDSFNWEGPYEDATKRDEWKRRFCQIVAIDAISFRDPREQYTKDNIKRELNKAYVGFRKDPNMPADYTPAIATGNWGCGAFNGDPRLKALIQMMAAAVAERDLAFFTFGNKNQAQDLQRMHLFLKTHQVTVGKLYELLNKYCDHFSRYGHEKNVFDYIKDKTGPQTSQL